MGSLWGLPGPSRFVEAVADDLREGSSVVLRFGGGLPAGLADHLEQRTNATLARYAEERGWTAETPELWEAGTLDGPRERPVVHSALLLVQGRDRALNRRLWAGQAAVLLPLLEERRIELVDRNRHRFSRLPFETDYGVIETPEDMELGALVLYFSRHREGGRGVLGPARRLRTFRNELAHFRPLSFAQATHATLLNPIR